MKLVRENINFERGIEPKDALDLGISNTIMKKWIELQQEPGIGSMNLLMKKDDEVFGKETTYTDLHFLTHVSQMDYLDGSKGLYKKDALVNEYPTVCLVTYESSGTPVFMWVPVA